MNPAISRAQVAAYEGLVDAYLDKINPKSLKDCQKITSALKALFKNNKVCTPLKSLRGRLYPIKNIFNFPEIHANSCHHEEFKVIIKSCITLRIIQIALVEERALDGENNINFYRFGMPRKLKGKLTAEQLCHCPYDVAVLILSKPHTVAKLLDAGVNIDDIAGVKITKLRFILARGQALVDFVNEGASFQTLASLRMQLLYQIFYHKNEVLEYLESGCNFDALVEMDVKDRQSILSCHYIQSLNNLSLEQNSYFPQQTPSHFAVISGGRLNAHNLKVL